MIRLIIAIIISVGLFACFPKNLTGIYSSYVDHGVLMAGYTYTFHPDGSFEMKYWSDNISSNRIGKGTYIVDNRNLLLTFEKTVPKTSSYAIQKQADSGGLLSRLDIEIQDYEERGLIGVNIIIRDTGGELVANGTTNQSGKCTIYISRTDIPKIIEVSYLGMEGIKIPLPDSGAKVIDIYLSEKTGYIDAGEKRVYRLRLRGDYLNLKSAKGTIVLKRNQPHSQGE